MSFGIRDLEALDVLLLSRAAAVVPMRDVHYGNHDPRVIAMRHDVDDNQGSLDTALELAGWEHRRGYRSTYFLLHDSHYWADAPAAARQLVALGHEVGLHNNAIAEAIRQDRDPFAILADALHHLRRAVNVIGTVAHGDDLCYGPGRVLRFVNDELWMECHRGNYEGATRSLWDFGLKYDSNWLPRGVYLSESGGVWNREPVAGPDFGHKQLHMLVHPDWWSAAFDTEAVAA